MEKFLDPNTKVLLLVAHPDDEIIFCGGTLLTYPEAIWHIVAMTDDGRPEMFEKSIQQLKAQGVNIVFHKSLRLENIHIGTDQTNFENEFVLWNSAVKNEPLLRDIDIVITHNEAGEYGHPAHKLVNRVAINIYSNVWKFGYPNKQVQKQTIFSTEVLQIKNQIFNESYTSEQYLWQAIPEVMDQMLKQNIEYFTNLPGQRELTQKWITPFAMEILIDLNKIRSEVDSKFKVDPEKIAELAKWNHEYPIGLCAEIRNEMLDRIMESVNSPSSTGFRKLSSFLHQGGKIFPFWGVDKDMYFQNAIQIGTAILDVANDTVHPYKNPIEFYPEIEESPLVPIQSFEKVAEIDEKYWHYDVYPNIYFPNLAPAFPILAIVEAHRGDEEPINGLILQTDFIDFDHRNMQSVRNNHLFGLAHKFLFDSKYSNKRLPENMLEHLKKSVAAQNFQNINADMFRLSTDPSETVKVFEQYKLRPGSKEIPIDLVLKIKQMKLSGAKLKGQVLAKVMK